MSTQPKNAAHSAAIAILPAPQASAQPPAPADASPTPPPDCEITNPEGWTPAKQGKFLRALGATHNVSAAARAAGMSRQSAYRLRNRLKGEPFDIAWACAFRHHFDALADAALDRAINGVEVPHFFQGELVHTSRRYDERLTVALLAMRAHLTEIPRAKEHEHMLFPPNDFEALVERVETGEERWDDAPDMDGDPEEEDAGEW